MHGESIWLTPEQGGDRRGRPMPTPPGEPFVTTACVILGTVSDVSSIVLVRDDHPSGLARQAQTSLSTAVSVEMSTPSGSGVRLPVRSEPGTSKDHRVEPSSGSTATSRSRL